MYSGFGYYGFHQAFRRGRTAYLHQRFFDQLPKEPGVEKDFIHMTEMSASMDEIGGLKV